MTTLERDVLTLLVTGRTNREIARNLFISERTVSIHVSRILGKLEVGNHVVEVGVVMQHDGAVLFGDGGGEDVRTASGAVLTAPGEHGLNLAGATGDLRRERQIHESGRAQGTRCASSGTFASTHAHSIAEIARLRCRTDLKPCAERDFEKLSRVWTGPRGC